MDLSATALFAASIGCSILSLHLTISASPSNNNAQPNNIQIQHKQHKRHNEVSPDIRKEMLSRIISFFGTENFADIQNAFVIVVGLGGVGSHAVNMLVRSGVTNIRIIDFDQVTLSSLNRHALASFADVGVSKALVLKKRLLEIAPWARIEAVTEMFVGKEADRLLRPFDATESEVPPTYILDCIDDVNTKAELIAHCVKNNLKVLTSMGAGGKSDPTRLRVGQLSDCINDPLCQKIKWKLKKYGVAPEDVTGVFSNEKPCVELLPLSDEQAAAPQDFGAVDYLRLRTIPVLGTSPAIFGQAMASKVLCALGKQEYLPESCEHMSKNLKHKLKQTCNSWERRRFTFHPEGKWSGFSNGEHSDKDLDLDDDDIEFIVTQVWGSRCALSGKRFGGHQPLVLLRWRKDLPPTPDNLVLMSTSFAQEVVNEENDVTISVNCKASENAQRANIPGCFNKETTARIQKRLQWAKAAVGDVFEAPRLQLELRTTNASKSVSSSATSQSKLIMGTLFIGVAAACAGVTVGYAAAVAKAFQLGYQL